MSNAIQKLQEFVEYVEKKAKESEYGFDPDNTKLLRIEFERLRIFAEAEVYRFEGDNIAELIFLEGKFNTILTEAESRFKVHMAEKSCQTLKAVIAILVTLLGAVLARAFLW